MNASANNIPVQSLSIKIGGLQQPASVKNISSFIVDIYYSSSNDLVAQVTTSTVITTTPGTITSASVSPASTTTAATNVPYAFTLTVPNALPSGSKVTITVPSTVGFVAGGTCTHQGVTTACTALTTSRTVTVNLLNAVTAGSSISVTYSLFNNPGSTRTTDSFGFATFNAAGEGVDVLGSTPVTVTMAVPSLLTSVSLTRGSKQNGLQTSYTFIFTQPQPIVETSAVAELVFPSDITLPSTPVCTSGTLTLTCTLRNPTTLTIQFATVNSANNAYNFTIVGIRNPYSYRPTASIAITTKTSDLLYKYSAISEGLGLINTIPSDFSPLSFNFTNQFLTGSGNLNLVLSMADSPGYFLVQFAASFGVTASSQIACFANNFTPLCSLVLNNDTGLYQMKVSSTGIIPTATTLTFSTLTNPSTIPSDYTWVSSFTSDDYKIS